MSFISGSSVSVSSVCEEVEREDIDVDLEQDCSVQDIPLDDISPHPARSHMYDNDSDTDSYQSMDEEGSVSGVPGEDAGGRSGEGLATGGVPSAPPARRYKYRKSLVPSQAQLQSFNLKDGVNEITFLAEVRLPLSRPPMTCPSLCF